MAKKDTEARFIGQKKLIEYNNIDGRVQFTLDDGSGDTVTAAQFTAMAKDSRYDDGMVRINKWNDAISKIMEILLENEMKLIEKDFVTGRIDATIIENYQKAAAQLFGAKFEDFINLRQIHNVLVGNKENNMSEEQVEVTPEVAPEVAPEVTPEVAPETETAPETAA